MSEGCFPSASSCSKYPYIGDLLYLKKMILFYILWNTEAAILVKILLDATFSGIPLTESFLREQIHSENLYEKHLQVIQPILKFPYLISFIKYPQVRHLK